MDLQIVIFLVSILVFLSGLMVIYFRFEKHRLEEEKEHKKLS